MRRCAAMPHRIESPFSFRLAEKITGVPGGTVPFRYGEAKGIFSFEKRMSPRPPKEKRGGISISPRTPLKRHKGRGPWPPPLETNPQGDEGRETRIKQETDRVVRSEAERTRAEIRRFGFPPRCAPPPQMRGHADLRFGYSAAGRRLPDFFGSA